jgi:hypothetical protein
MKGVNEEPVHHTAATCDEHMPPDQTPFMSLPCLRG